MPSATLAVVRVNITVSPSFTGVVADNEYVGAGVVLVSLIITVSGLQVTSFKSIDSVS